MGSLSAGQWSSLVVRTIRTQSAAAVAVTGLLQSRAQLTAVGATDLFLQHETPHVAPRAPHPQWLLNWEARRPRWLIEMVAEAL